MSLFRPMAGVFNPLCIEGDEYLPDARYLAWPTSDLGPERGPELKVCRTIMHCDPTADPKDLSNMVKEDDCPLNDRDWINKVLEAGKEWKPPITGDEAVLALLWHAVEGLRAEEEAKKAAGKEGEKGVNTTTPPTAPIEDGPDTAATTEGDTKDPNAQKLGESVGAPAPVQEGVAGRCIKWHVAKEKDSCYSIAEEAGIDIGSLYRWNKVLWTPWDSNNPDTGECIDLWIGYAYCVKAYTDHIKDSPNFIE
ncbi:hypothetical protein BJ508DRAFT_358178 [Ascobolus immersus RN42]|uniref:LysM domain-containing protein n=1 Tax=Ascobolus immersus RN42 TaxID=1160509 RepID=A0A3N4IY43_ASCIM|nr:hypothetical protein BJ508DRAFT_358178 [Ascobolus immersus RN42]